MKISWDYVAGFFDADGSINKRKRRPCSWGIDFVNTNRDVLEEIRKFIKAGHIYTKKDKRDNHKQAYYLGFRRHKSVLRVVKELAKRCIVKKEKLIQASKEIESHEWQYARKDEAWMKSEMCGKR